jgi:hypothetical protein
MILAIYDITGIQRYVFSSNRMKENVGASLAVELALSEWLPASINAALPEAKVVWDDGSPFMLPTMGTKASVVYIGGGNALVLYYDHDAYKQVNQEFSLMLLEKTAGELSYAVSWIEVANPAQDIQIKDLFYRLMLAKARQEPASPLLGIAITREGSTDSLPAVHIELAAYRDGFREGSTDSLPAVHIEGDKYLSQNAKTKIDLSQEREVQLCTKLDTQLKFPKLLDDLGMVEGENYIAVVHIDGNDMGSLIKDVASQGGGLKSQLANLREMSLAISNKYIEVFRGMLGVLEHNQTLQEFQRSFKLAGSGLLIRPLVVNGDDVTFVVDGRLGLPLGREFLKRLSADPVQIGGKERRLSACAGIAIVKAHFPFYRAYRLAEELCASAKGKAQALEPDNKGCWIDWHIAQGGMAAGLDTIREKHYQVPGMANSFIMGADGFKTYNLLWRPWKVGGNGEFDFDHFLSLHKALAEIPRSRIKELRNLSIEGEVAVETCIEAMAARDYKLPEFGGDKEYFKSNHITPYFDVIESGEMYYELQGGTQ